MRFFKTLFRFVQSRLLFFSDFLQRRGALLRLFLFGEQTLSFEFRLLFLRFERGVLFFRFGFRLDQFGFFFFGSRLFFREPFFLAQRGFLLGLQADLFFLRFSALFFEGGSFHFRPFFLRFESGGLFFRFGFLFEQTLLFFLGLRFFFRQSGFLLVGFCFLLRQAGFFLFGTRLFLRQSRFLFFGLRLFCRKPLFLAQGCLFFRLQSFVFFLRFLFFRFECGGTLDRLFFFRFESGILFLRFRERFIYLDRHAFRHFLFGECGGSFFTLLLSGFGAERVKDDSPDQKTDCDRNRGKHADRDHLFVGKHPDFVEKTTQIICHIFLRKPFRQRFS